METANPPIIYVKRYNTKNQAEKFIALRAMWQRFWWSPARESASMPRQADSFFTTIREWAGISDSSSEILNTAEQMDNIGIEVFASDILYLDEKLLVFGNLRGLIVYDLSAEDVLAVFNEKISYLKERDEALKQTLQSYVEMYDLDIRYYKDFGWDPVDIFED